MANLRYASQIIELLDASEFDKIAELLQDTEKLNNAVMDLVSAVCQYVAEHGQGIDPHVSMACDKVLIHIANTCNAKEVILALQEQSSFIQNDAHMRCLLKPLQICLFASNKQLPLCSEIIRPFVAYLTSLPLPDDRKLEGKEKLLLDADSTVNRLTNLVILFLDFLSPIVSFMSWKTVAKASDESSQQQLKDSALANTVHLLNLLDKPLAYLDTSSDLSGNTPESESRLCVTKVMALLSELQADFHRLVIYITDRIKESRAKASGKEEEEVAERDGETSVSALSLATFAYLTFAEQLGCNNLPGLFTSHYYLNSCLPFVSELLSQRSSIIAYKGVRLLNALLSTISEASLSIDMLESRDFLDTIHCLVQALSVSQVQELTTSLGKLLSMLLSRFTLEGRQKLLLMLLHIANHSGIVAYTIQLLKNEIDVRLKTLSPDGVNDDVYFGKNLQVLMNVVLSLPSGVKTDLLENCERITAALNLLRYLVIRDKQSTNVTGIWTMMEKVKIGYCQTLHKAIDISRGHYKLDIDNTIQEGKHPKDRQLSEATEFSVGGKTLPSPSHKEKIEALTIAVHRLDLMESLLCRFEELAEPKL